jgi:uncharacterized protein DUF6335
MAKRPKARPARTRRQAPKTATRRGTPTARKAKKASTAGRTAGSARKTAKKPQKARKPAAAPARAKAAAPRPRAKAAAPAASKSAKAPEIRKRPFLDRERRTVDALDETLRTPPSSLDLDRHGSAARSGRAALRRSEKEHTGMSPDLASGDSDVDLESAYFTGEEAPGGDNPTPDQNVVDDIGKALGVQYQDGEELQASDKVVERDEHRWELDPASSEDYRDRNER